jgi:hypothetical protein
VCACARVLYTHVLARVVHAAYRGADKFLARPGRKQTTETEDFDIHISHLLQ